MDPHLNEKVLVLQKKLDIALGFGWWKKYIAAAFWSNLSTPFNLSITLLTALTTAQATTDEGFLPKKAYMGISISTLIISVVNTFFKPHQQSTENIKIMNQWWELGNKFEEIFYTACNTPEELEKRYQDYLALQKEINQLEISQSPETQNFLTDLIHLIARNTALRNKDRWLDLETKSDLDKPLITPVEVRIA